MDVKMDTKKSRNALGMLAGCLGVAQGVTWAILCLLGILIYTEAWTPKYGELVTTTTTTATTTTPASTQKPGLFALGELSETVRVTTPKPSVEQSYSTLINVLIMNTYLTSPSKVPELYKPIVTPTHFFVWMIIYLLISVVWTIVSGMLLFALQQPPVKQIYLKSWSSCTMLVCVLDFILTVMIGIDYGLFASKKEMYFFALAAGIVMTIVARGFVLWVVNAALAALLLLKKSEAPQSYYNGSNTLNAFEPPSHPSPAAYNNPRYDFDNPNFVRSNSSAPTENLPRLPPIATTNERLAKIGKPAGNRSPYSPNYAQNVAPPSVPSPYVYPTSARIPSPDYSPPTTPRIPPQPPLKPALKNRLDYNYGYNNKY